MSNLVEKSFNYKDLLNKKLVLGQTRWVCRYGTLGDGHEHLSDAQRYFQAIKEAYYIACSLKRLEATRLKIEADLLEAEILIECKESRVTQLRGASAKKLAELAMIENQVTEQDLTRMLDEYNKIIEELGPAVDAKYPEGIEQAEKDHWENVFKYRMVKSLDPRNRETVSNVPLPPEDKARLGSKYHRIDALAHLSVTDEPKYLQILESRFTKQVEAKT